MGFDHHLMAAGSIIDAYAKCRRMKSARLVYDSLPEKDLISTTALISSYAKSKGGGGDPLKLFATVNAAAVSMDDVIVCACVSACADFLSLSMGRQIHALIFKKLPGSDVAMANALIDMYAKCGELDDSRRVFDEMSHRNVVTWTCMITAFGRHGEGEAALSLMEEMERQGCRPNDVTFLAALSACGHSGLTKEGKRLFHYMVVDRGISPRSEHYACFVDLLARGGQLEEAFDFVGQMGSTWRSSSLWGALLGACGVHGYVSLGEMAAVRLFRSEPESSVNYVVLSNIYMSACLWGNAMSVRRLMDERSRGGKGCGYSLLHWGNTRETPLLLESG